MTDKLSNPVSSTLCDKGYAFLKLRAEHTNTDPSNVIRDLIMNAYDEQMREVNVYQPLLEMNK